MVFRHFLGEGVEFFFKSDLTDPPSDFWCAFFGNYRFKPFQISFSNGFYIKIMFWVTWFYNLFERMRLKRKNDGYSHRPLVTSFYIKSTYFFAELAIQRWSPIFCATGAWGVKQIGRVRVKIRFLFEYEILMFDLTLIIGFLFTFFQFCPKFDLFWTFWSWWSSRDIFWETDAKSVI